MKIAVVAITRHGITQAARCLAALEEAVLFVPEKFHAEAETCINETHRCHGYHGKTADQIPVLFEEFDALICLISLGAVVRLIAPHLKSKDSDPAIVVVDEAGRFVIPLLSGHTGGANALAMRLATQLDAQSVLTTASDARQTLAVDLLGQEFGWQIEADHNTRVRASAAVVNGEPVAIVQEAGSPDWWPGHAHGRAGSLPDNLHLFGQIEQVATENFAVVLWISTRPLPVDIATRVAGRCVIYRP
ncbi:MAG: cobalamin biosynthesis protein CbiG [Sterolibacterium sp.]|jgi:cobalt-precorrin 5A hydrolase|nr:cobalamin biosynthesis protein CbiG [Sterolibacterium sp.]